MARCQIVGCTNEVGINPKTGKMNMLCREHFLESVGKKTSSSSKGSGKSSFQRKSPAKKKPKIAKTIKPEMFILRGNMLTINLTAKTYHIKVDRFTRAVMFNDDIEGSSGKMFHYVIAIKQGSETLQNLLFDNKAERNREFAKLQVLLSTLY